MSSLGLIGIHWDWCHRVSGWFVGRDGSHMHIHITKFEVVIVNFVVGRYMLLYAFAMQVCMWRHNANVFNHTQYVHY